MNPAKASTSPVVPSRGAARLASRPTAITPGIRVSRASRASRVSQTTMVSVPWCAATLAAMVALESAVLYGRMARTPWRRARRSSGRGWPAWCSAWSLADEHKLPETSPRPTFTLGLDS
jgi:hypothetical protein